VSGGYAVGAFGNYSSVSGGGIHVAYGDFDWIAGGLFQDQ
jgi:hypothetical protein